MEDTIVGPRWLDFLASGRAVVGAESGSSVLDRRGEIRSAVQQLLREDPSLTFAEVDARMPAGWDDHEFFAISPRHLESVITRTCQVLVEGSYEGVLLPEIHYIPVLRDLSNLDVALARLHDRALVKRLTTQAYQDVVESGRYSYRVLASGLLDEIDAARRRAALPSSFSFAIERGWPVAQAALDLSARRPRTLARLASYPPELLIRTAASLPMLLSSVPLARLVVVGLRDAELRGSLGRRRLLADAVRLGQLLRSAHHSDEPLGHVIVGEDSLVLALGERSGIPIVGAQLDAAFRATRPPRIESAEGAPYRFQALELLARSRPNVVLEALRPLFRRRAGALGGLLARALEHPLVYAGHAATVVRFTQQLSPDIRRALLATGRSAGTGTLLRDLLRLALVRRAFEAGEFSLALEYDASARTAVLKTGSTGGTSSGSGAEVGQRQPLERVVLDHSATGSALAGQGDSGPPVGLGASGVYELASLGDLASRDRERTWQLLVTVADGRQRA